MWNVVAVSKMNTKMPDFFGKYNLYILAMFHQMIDQNKEHYKLLNVIKILTATRGIIKFMGIIKAILCPKMRS